jgi:quercetin dioxygenase-like cupin family protein
MQTHEEDMSLDKARVALFCYITVAFSSGVIVGPLAFPSLNAQVGTQERSQKTTRLMTTDLAGFCDGKEAVVEYHEEAQGPSAKHYHPGHSFSYMIEGSRTVIVDGKPQQAVPVGGVHYEAPMKANVSINASPAKVITFRILEKGKPETVVAP